MTNTAELYDAFGNHLRTCPRGPLECLDVVRRRHPSVADVRLSADQREIAVTFPGSPRVYGYMVRLDG